MPELMLASGSPRRRELLAQIGYSFSIDVAGIDETRLAGEAPAAYVERLAREKAEAVLARHPAMIVLGADTTVDLDGETLNKPADEAEAEAMLRRLSGRRHLVHTGIAAVRDGWADTWVETTAVEFGRIDERSLRQYLATGDSLDKAGGYGVQGFAARWIPRIEGCFFNVMGLPLASTARLLRDAGL